MREAGLLFGPMLCVLLPFGQQQCLLSQWYEKQEEITKKGLCSQFPKSFNTIRLCCRCGYRLLAVSLSVSWLIQVTAGVDWRSACVTARVRKRASTDTNTQWKAHHFHCCHTKDSTRHWLCHHTQVARKTRIIGQTPAAILLFSSPCLKLRGECLLSCPEEQTNNSHIKMMCYCNQM